MKQRPYETEEDYWRMREFLREVYLLNDRHERSWHVARLDYYRWHICLNCTKIGLEEIVYLWESDGQIVAFVIGDAGPGAAHFCVHPAFRSVELEEEMIAVAEEHLIGDSAASKRLGIWASDRDVLRRELLSKRGYERQRHECQWRRHFHSSVPNAALPPGYSIKAVGKGLELLERVYASGLGFHEGDINTAVENRNDPSWYHNLQRAPLYRRDLDLVATASDGSICSLCTVWLDDVTRSGYVQPVATIPAHQRKGLARAVLTEACNRAWRMGATILCIAGVAIDGNALYRSVMGPDHDRYAVWVRKFASE